MEIQVPPYHEFFKPTVDALRALGGSGNIQENDKVCELEGYSETLQSILHKDGPQTEINYR
jgi:restriction system protein